MKKFFSGLFLSLITLLSVAQTTTTFTQFATGFADRPVCIASAGDSRLFVCEQNGVIRIVDSLGNINPTPFLNISSIVQSGGNEQGLLSVAFPPDYATSGVFYVDYTKNSTSFHKAIARYHVSANPDVADPLSAEIILEFYHPYTNHNGGDLQFGPDGYLYDTEGDGGSGGDPGGRAQNKDSLLGKIIRLDVSTPTGYAIPPTNPFAGAIAGRDEIWDYGVRNPWRVSFDKATGEYWIADVGQSNWEEIDVEPANDTGGHNYGWKCYEGNAVYSSSGVCASVSGVTFPLHVYSHGGGNCSITGGYVYRGSQCCAMFGKYIFSDYCGQTVVGLKRTGASSYILDTLGTPGDYPICFGQDYHGELYVGLETGGIKKLVFSNCVSISGIDSSSYCNNHAPITLTGMPAGGSFSGSGITGNVFDPAAAALGTVVLSYTYSDTSAGGCSQTYNDTITVTNCTGISSPQNLCGVSLHPNPANDATVIDINSARAGEGKVIIEDLTGRILQTELFQLVNGKNAYLLKLENLSPGCYMVRISTAGEQVFAKFVKL